MADVVVCSSVESYTAQKIASPTNTKHLHCVLLALLAQQERSSADPLYLSRCAGLLVSAYSTNIALPPLPRTTREHEQQGARRLSARAGRRRRSSTRHRRRHGGRGSRRGAATTAVWRAAAAADGPRDGDVGGAGCGGAPARPQQHQLVLARS